MLFNQPLPPQFLLPAWSARQLASAVQRAHLSDVPDTSPLRATTIPANESAELLNSARIESGPISKWKWGHHRFAELSSEASRARDPAGGEQYNLEQSRNGIQETAYQGEEPRASIAHHKSEESLKSPWSLFRASNSTGYSDQPRATKSGFTSSTEQPKNSENEQRNVRIRWRKSGLQIPRSLVRFHPVHESVPKPSQSDTKEEVSVLPDDKSGMVSPTWIQSNSSKMNSKLASINPQSDTKKLKLKRRASLFEELFPELTLSNNSKEMEALDILAKLPAFDWKMNNTLESVDESRETTLDNHQEIVESDDLKQIRPRSRYEPLWQDEPSVLVLSFSSKQLEESDFFRVGPKGEHIEGWTSGIIKVIPARDEETFQFRGHYYLIFSSDAAARAYLDQTIRLHKLSEMRGIDKDAFIPPPPSYLGKGEDIDAVLRGFSLVPGHSKLSLRMISRPYTPYMKRTLRYGGPVAAASQQAKTEYMVLFYLDVGYMSLYDLIGLLKEDGSRRNLHWKLAGGYDNIFRVKEGKVDGEENKEASGRQLHTRQVRYVVPFVDQQEARRFVREWHRQPLPMQREPNAGDGLLSTVNAELIW